MILRRLGVAAGMVLAGIVVLWIGALTLLPDAPIKLGRATGGAPPAAPPAVRTGKLAIPVEGVSPASLADSWGDDRDGGARAHHGTDIPAARGTAVRAAAPGRVEKLFQSAAGGITLYVRSQDRRWTYYYAHLLAYAPGVREGMRVRAGDMLGYVGDTGNAGVGNYHLHFGLAHTAPSDRWYQGQDVDPFPYLVGKALPR